MGLFVEEIAVDAVRTERSDPALPARPIVFEGGKLGLKRHRLGGVLLRRLEPVGLVFLWPETRG